MLKSLFPIKGVPARQAGMLPRPLDEDLNALVERFFGEGLMFNGGDFVPNVDVSETDTAYEVAVDLPGLRPEEVNVELKGNDLWITGKREEKFEEKEKTFHRVERKRGVFRRVLPMSGAIQEAEIDAYFDNGVLMIHVPKSEELKPRKIEVRT